MAHLFPTEAWSQAYKDAVNANEKYRVAGKPWTYGPVAMIVEADPSIGLEQDACMLLDVEGGECRSTTFSHSRADVDSAPFVVVAPYARWKLVVQGQLDPIKAMMEGKLKLTKGHLPTMLRFVESSRQLVMSATMVDTEFMA